MKRFTIPAAEWAKLQQLSRTSPENYLTEFRAVGARMGFDISGYVLIDAKHGIIEATPVAPPAPKG